jgi:coenzyme Q-binding protein COQ10
MSRHTEQRHLHYTPEQLFDLIADVERYPEFLPWLLAAHVGRRDGDRVWVEMVIGTRFLQRRFTSQARLSRPRRIDISSHDTLFRHFEQVWTFTPAADGGTVVEHRIDFSFRSRLLQALMGSWLAQAARETVSAFSHRARAIYGPDGRPSA